MFFLDIFFEGLFANFEKVYTFASANKRVGDLLNIVLWCNGSTTDSGPVCQGSNPCRTTTDQTYTVAGVSRRAKISERAHSSAGLEHLSYKQRVIGSNPIGPTISSRYNYFKFGRVSLVRVGLFFCLFTYVTAFAQLAS